MHSLTNFSTLSSRDRVARTTAHSDSGKLQFSTTEIYDFTAGNSISTNCLKILKSFDNFRGSVGCW